MSTTTYVFMEKYEQYFPDTPSYLELCTIEMFVQVFENL